MLKLCQYVKIENSKKKINEVFFGYILDFVVPTTIIMAMLIGNGVLLACIFSARKR